jgi:signal peptidase
VRRHSARADAPAGSAGGPAEKTLAQYLAIAVMGAVLVLLTAVAALVIVVPVIAGGSALTVLTNSMAPKFPPGTLIVVRPTAAEDIHIGQVLTYQIASGQPAVISHRVVQRNVDLDGSVSFITKGDNNAVADPSPVREVQVKGTLWYAIPWLGWVNSVVSGESRAVAVPVVAGLLFAYTGYLVLSSVLASRRRRRRRGQDPRSPRVRAIILF